MGQHPFQTNFTGGEQTPFLGARVDYKKYPNGAELLIDSVVNVMGGASRRAGTQFVAQARGRGAFQPSMVQDNAFQTHNSRGVRLVEFIFNTNEAYVLEFGSKYIRFYRNRQQLLGNGSGPELVTNGTFNADLSGWTLQQDNGATVVQAAPGVAQLATGAAGFAGISQQISGLVPGVKYAVTFEVGGAGLALEVGTSFGLRDLAFNGNIAAGSYRALFVAPSNGTVFLRWWLSAPATVSQLDNVTLKEATPLEIETPYEAEHIRSLRFASSADVLYITHTKYAARKLIRLSELLWTLQEVVFVPPPTREVDIQPQAKLTPGAVLGQGVTFTTDAIAFVNADVNRQIKSRGGVAIITAFVNGQQVTADIVSPFLSTDQVPAGLWSLDGSPSSIITFAAGTPVNAITGVTATTAAFRSTDVGGFIHALDGIFEITAVTSSTTLLVKILKIIPGATLVAQSGAWTLEFEEFSEGLGYADCVNFFEQRLWFSKGFTLYGSRVGDFENFGLGVNDDDAVKYPIVNGSNQVDVIRWMKSMKELMLGTTGSEYRIRGANESSITASAPPLVHSQSEWGSDPEPDARKAGKAVIFTQRGRRQIREMAFSIEDDGYNAADISVLAEHLFRDGIVELARVSSPESYLLAVLEDGRMACATYAREEDVVAWTQFRPAGWPFKAQYVSVCVIPAKCGSGDEVWALVDRNIGGSRTTTVEVFDGQLNTDCALVYDDDIRVETLVGLSHLEGETVDELYTSPSAFQKNAFQMSAFQRVRARHVETTVVGGGVEVPSPSVRVEVGLHYDNTIKTLPLEVQTQQGTAHFRKKRDNTIYVRFFCSKGDGITVNGEAVPRKMLEDRELVDFTKEANLGWDRALPVTIKNTKPFGMTVLGVSRSTQVDDGDAP